MFVVSLQRVSQNLKQSKCSTGEWTIHKIKCYSATKRNKLLAHTMWMNLTNIMLSEKDQKENNTYCNIQFIWIFRRGKTNSWWSKLVVACEDRHWLERNTIELPGVIKMYINKGVGYMSIFYQYLIYCLRCKYWAVENVCLNFKVWTLITYLLI